MATWTIEDLAKKMRDIDFVMLQTKTEGGAIAGRPMSNNGDVEYDGDSWFFLTSDSRTFRDLQADPKVNLAMQGSKGLFGSPPLFISIEGTAEIIEDKKLFEEHWVSDLERWWPEGVETQGLRMIKVHASRVHYWSGEDEGEIRL